MNGTALATGALNKHWLAGDGVINAPHIRRMVEDSSYAMPETMDGLR